MSIPKRYKGIGRQRVVLEKIGPILEGGAYPVKRIVGDEVQVHADLFADGHEALRAALYYKHRAERKWQMAAFRPAAEDYYTGSFRVTKEGEYQFFIAAWVDTLQTWRHGLDKKVAAGQDVGTELLAGAEHFREVAGTAAKKERKRITEIAELLEDRSRITEAVKVALNGVSAELIEANPLYADRTESPKYRVRVERQKAGFSAWYEFFPRSSSGTIERHGTFKDAVKNVLPVVAQMGFDVVYLPPVHPIGVSFRKGPNNSTTCHEGDPGSPWAIGSAEGGHEAIHPELGTLKDFRAFVKKARELDIEVSIDLAFQCSPDHPWVKEHPQWFKWRPDGTVQYAENPPKKYQDVLPLHFETEDWQALWQALLDLTLYWIEQGVTIFRVDNPHTKPFHFWEWFMAEVNGKHPDIIFLAEAFTAPRTMARLGKVGFQQSYTYFTWKNTKGELEDYVNNLVNSELRDYFRPNFWPNTPDILGFNLQYAPPAAFAIRWILAATLSGNYGMYGPVYEKAINVPVHGIEEYDYSEKYEIKAWDWSEQIPLRDLIGRVNRIRKDQPALQDTYNISFNETNSDQLISYTKVDATGKDMILVVVSLNPHGSQSGWVRLPMQRLDLWPGQSVTMQDLVTNVKYTWKQEWNFVELHTEIPFHLFRLIKSDH